MKKPCQVNFYGLKPVKIYLSELEAVSKLLSSRNRAIFTLARRRLRIAAGLIKVTSRTQKSILNSLPPMLAHLLFFSGAGGNCSHSQWKLSFETASNVKAI